MNRKTADTITDDELDALYERLEAAEPPRQQAIHDALYEASVDGALVFVDDATTAVMDVLQARRATAQRPAAGTGSGAATPSHRTEDAPSRPTVGP